VLPEVLVPIRLDIDMDGQKLRDTFTWNKNGMYTCSQAVTLIHSNTTYVCNYLYIASYVALYCDLMITVYIVFKTLGLMFIQALFCIIYKGTLFKNGKIL